MVTMKKIDPIKSGTFFLILSGALGLVFGVFTTGATLLGFSISKRSNFFLFSEDRLYLFYQSFM